MKVFIFTAECEEHGREIIAVLNYEPTYEQQWEILEAHIRKAFEGESTDDKFIKSVLDQYPGSEFSVEEHEVVSL